IAHPPSLHEVCSRRCGNWRGRSGVLIPHMAGKRKQEVLEVRDAAVTLLSQPGGGCVTCAWASCTRRRSSRSTGAQHVPTQTRGQTPLVHGQELEKRRGWVV